jgi:hypothetical protein
VVGGEDGTTDERPGEDAVILDAALLADLDAGVLDGERARDVGAAAAADPDAQAVLDALAATRADLAAAPDPPVPAAVAARWRAAITRTAPDRAGPGRNDSAGTPVGPTMPPAPPGTGTPSATATSAGTATPGTVRRGAAPGPSGRGRIPSHTGHGRAPTDGRPPAGPPARPRRAPWRRPAVLAAVALLAVLATALVLGRGPGDGPGSDPGGSGVPVTAATLVTQATVSMGLHDTGPYEDPGRRTACLATVRPPGVAPTAPLLGGRRVVYEGRAGYLLLLGTGRLGIFDVVVVDPGCTTRLASVRVEP